jgi:divinyl chlorophyllide a 8-vinyl-reductase
MRVCVFGATGTIGRATVTALVEQGHEVVAVTRDSPGDKAFVGAEVKQTTALDPASLAREVFAGEPFEAAISCMASRTGLPSDAWAVDYAAHIAVLDGARRAGVGHFVLLSAICVQKPLLAFQQAKLAFEKALIESGMRYSIVRPTAFFKSLSGQIDRVRRGRPFLLFGDGTLTACKPISDRDLAEFMIGCLTDESRRNRILPIGGPGPAITPRQQGEALFTMLGREPKFRAVPPALLSAIATGLGVAGRMMPRLAAKSELARIGHYYATESMLLLNPQSGRYDAAATPSTGTDMLFEHYREVLAGTATVERGDHSVF